MGLFSNYKAFLYLLAASVFVALVWYAGAARYRAAALALFSAENFKRLIPPELPFRRKIKTLLFLGGIFFLFLALSGPQWGRKKQAAGLNVKYSQSVVCLDLSNSMLAEDFRPNRLESAKLMITMMLEGLQNERLGLIGFTSLAYLQCPVTTDISALKMMTSRMSEGTLPVQGTSLQPVIALAVRMLKPYEGTKAVIIISDGEDHQKLDIETALKEAKENNIRIIAVGIGSAEGEIIPVLNKEGKREFKKDKQGKTVLSKLDEQTLKKIASLTGGVYIKFSNAQQTADEVLLQIKSLDKSASRGVVGSIYKNRYQIPLAAGFLLLVCSILIPLRKVK